jgi:hypothetical protein
MPGMAFSLGNVPPPIMIAASEYGGQEVYRHPGAQDVCLRLAGRLSLKHFRKGDSQIRRKLSRTARSPAASRNT